MKTRKVSNANKRRDARRARFDSMRAKGRGFKRPGSRNPHQGG